MSAGYTGKPYDFNTRLSNYGYRDYAAHTGRFTTVDPIRDGRNWYAYCNNDPVNWVDEWGLSASDGQSGEEGAQDRKYPKAPPGVDLDQHIFRSQLLPFIVWLDNVRPGGAWDYKLIDLKLYEDYGNFEYGATGRAQGFSEETLLRAAGLVQLAGSNYDSDNGVPWGASPYRDEPKDQVMIKLGIQYYEENIERINREKSLPLLKYPPSSYPY